MADLHKFFGQLNLNDAAHVTTAPLLVPGQIVRLRAHTGSYLRIGDDGTVGLGGLGHLTHFQISEAPNHAVRFESVIHKNKFLGIDADADKVMAGKGGPWCHFNALIQRPGVISLQRVGTTVFVGVNAENKLKAPSQTKTGVHGQFTIEAILEPAMIGLHPGVEIRLKHSKGHLRITKDKHVDCKGRDGELTYFKVNIAQGNITLQSVATGAFLGHSHFSATAGPQPAYFSFFFSAADRKVALMVNDPPKHMCIGFKPDGMPAPPSELKPADSLLELVAGLHPSFFGIAPRHTTFRFRVPTGKYFRSNAKNEADFIGGDGPAPWMKLVMHASGSHTVGIFNVHSGGFLRCSPHGGFDFGAKEQGPNAALRIVSLGGDHVALHTLKGYINTDGSLTPRPTAASAFTLELKN